MRNDSQPLSPGATLSTTFIQNHPQLLDSLEQMLTQNPLDVFSHDDWDILCHLPASKHWKFQSEPMVSEVCRLEYKVVNLEDILDDEEDEPRFITDASERAELEAIRYWSPLVCSPRGLSVPLGYLLEKVSCMHDDQERTLDSMLEDSYACLVALATRQAVTPRFLEVLEVLQSTPIWAAYLRANPQNPLARNTRKLVSRLRSKAPGFHAKPLRCAHA